MTAESKCNKTVILDEELPYSQGLLYALKDFNPYALKPNLSEGVSSKLFKELPSLAIVGKFSPTFYRYNILQELESLGIPVAAVIDQLDGVKSFQRISSFRNISGFIDRADTIEGIIEGVRHIQAGKIYISPSLNGLLLEGIKAPSVPRRNLSTRELEIGRLVAQGKTNRQISHDLTIGEKTVKAHVEHALHKTGCANRTQFAAKVLRGEIVF